MKIKGWIKPYLYCFLIAFLFLMVCSKNSSLYYMNDWVDANAFFTVGKGMVRGIVPYQSLFEQKGPLLYLIYGIGSFIHYQSFLGVFILEVFSFSIFLYFTYKIIILFYNEKSAYFIIPVFTLLLVTLKSFSHGGSAEEFTLPFFMVSLYFLISYLKSEELLLSNKIIFLIGILAGCVLWIKYTLLGFWFGWMACVFVIECYNGQSRQAIVHCFVYLFGMLIATIPWLIYFGIHNALGNLWNVYFVVNMNAYPNSNSLLAKIMKTFRLLYKNLFMNFKACLGIVIGFLFLWTKKTWWAKKGACFCLVICLLTTGIFIYIGGTNYHYYPFILSPFMLIGFLVLLSYLPQSIYRLQIPVIVISIIFAYSLSVNTKMLVYQKEDYAQYRFSKIIEKSMDSTLLNYGFLDGGFYT